MKRNVRLAKVTRVRKEKTLKAGYNIWERWWMSLSSLDGIEYVFKRDEEGKNDRKNGRV